MPRVKSGIKMLYLDIETTPHEGSFWNLFPKYIPIGQLSKATEVLCWAAAWQGQRDVTFRNWKDPDHMQKMWDLLEEADCVVHYNGKSFDMKHLNREFARLGLPPPSHYDQVDLLSEVRKNFKLASNKLDFVVNYFGLGGKVKHAGIELWYGCIDDNPKDWKIMTRYNKQDVKLLPKLYKFMLPWIKSHPNLGLLVDAPTSLVCPTCASQGKHTELDTLFRTKTQEYKQYRCQNCDTTFRERSRNKKASTFITVRTP
jgi:DNA polymerase elongation subunit (family B)